MFSFVLRLCGYAYHPPFVCHAYTECPACRAIRDRRELRRLCHELAIECLRHHVRFDSLFRAALLSKEPSHEELADARVVALAKDAPY